MVKSSFEQRYEQLWQQRKEKEGDSRPHFRQGESLPRACETEEVCNERSEDQSKDSNLIDDRFEDHDKDSSLIEQVIGEIGKTERDKVANSAREEIGESIHSLDATKSNGNNRMFHQNSDTMQSNPTRRHRRASIGGTCVERVATRDATEGRANIPKRRMSIGKSSSNHGPGQVAEEYYGYNTSEPAEVDTREPVWQRRQRRASLGKISSHDQSKDSEEYYGYNTAEKRRERSPSRTRSPSSERTDSQPQRRQRRSSLSRTSSHSHSQSKDSEEYYGYNTAEKHRESSSSTTRSPSSERSDSQPQRRQRRSSLGRTSSHSQSKDSDEYCSYNTAEKHREGSSSTTRSPSSERSDSQPQRRQRRSSLGRTSSHRQISDKATRTRRPSSERNETQQRRSSLGITSTHSHESKNAKIPRQPSPERNKSNQQRRQRRSSLGRSSNHRPSRDDEECNGYNRNGENSVPKTRRPSSERTKPHSESRQQRRSSLGKGTVERKPTQAVPTVSGSRKTRRLPGNVDNTSELSEGNRLVLSAHILQESKDSFVPRGRREGPKKTLSIKALKTTESGDTNDSELASRCNRERRAESGKNLHPRMRRTPSDRSLESTATASSGESCFSMVSRCSREMRAESRRDRRPGVRRTPSDHTSSTGSSNESVFSMASRCSREMRAEARKGRCQELRRISSDRSFVNAESGDSCDWEMMNDQPTSAEGPGPLMKRGSERSTGTDTTEESSSNSNEPHMKQVSDEVVSRAKAKISSSCRPRRASIY